MEELMERVSAILDSPVLGYTWHKTYRQMFVLCLVYLLCFCSNVFADNASYTFEPYRNDIKTEKTSVAKPSESIDEHLENYTTMRDIDNISATMNEIDELFQKLEVAIKDMAKAEPLSRDDRRALFRGFAELDGVLTYAYTRLDYGKDMLKSANPVTEEEKAKCNSLKVRFLANMRLANELRAIIAEKLADAPKRKNR